MHVKTKKLTISAACLALSMILILAESVFGVSTLSLYALAGVLLGIVIMETGLKGGFPYLFASVLLSFFLAPDKGKLVTYYGIEAYIFLSEAVYELMARRGNRFGQKIPMRWMVRAIQLLVFNLIFIPIVIFLPELILTEVDFKWKLIAVLAGQPLWFLFETVYTRLLHAYRDRLRKKVL